MSLVKAVTPTVEMIAPNFSFIANSSSETVLAMRDEVMFRCSVVLKDECEFSLSGDHSDFGDPTRKPLSEFWEEGQTGYTAEFPIQDMTDGYKFTGSAGIIKLSVEYDIVYIEEQ